MSFEFTKENIDLYLKELAKAYRRLVGKEMPAELVLIGGASVLINYGFRNMTTDIDALIKGASAMKDAINQVGDKYNLPNGWLNTDFMHTESYSPKLAEHAKHYKTLSNVLELYTVSAEYLIAMKLRSGRQYKSDLSDVLGILAEHEKKDSPISLGRIQAAAVDLYGGWNALPESSRNYIGNVMENGDYETLFAKVRAGEQETKTLLIEYEKHAPGVMKQSNVNVIADKLQSKSDRASVLKQLREIQASQSEATLQPAEHDRNEHER